uniref:exodeoxyribonuclease III n=1 Tax=Mola mola TaxID=94237 RepID=A0A3Q3XLR0_MOLML
MRECLAAGVTGFRIHKRRLYLHQRPVLTNSLREVLVSFLAFLRMLGHPLVVGHNIRRFDCPLLARALGELGLRAQFDSSVSGCVDTLSLARELLKGRGLQSFRQENLVRELLGVDYKAHDALEDVRALQALYRVLQPSAELVCRHRFTLGTIGTTPASLPPPSEHVVQLSQKKDFRALGTFEVLIRRVEVVLVKMLKELVKPGELAACMFPS